MIDRLLFSERDRRIIIFFRITFPLSTMWGLWFMRNNLINRADSVLCYPMPLFEALSIPLLNSQQMNICFYLIYVTLAMTALGVFARTAAGVSAALFFWMIGSTISCASGKNPVYITWDHVIVIFDLFILALVNTKDKVQLNWPIFMLKFNLIYAYFAGGIAKLKHGLDWMNGYTLQGHLIYSHIQADTPLVLPIIKYLNLLIIISAIVLIAEIFAPLALFSRKLAIGFVAGSLLFQVAFFFLIDLTWMQYFGWCYLIYLAEVVVFVKTRHFFKDPSIRNERL